MLRRMPSFILGKEKHMLTIPIVLMVLMLSGPFLHSRPVAICKLAVRQRAGRVIR